MGWAWGRGRVGTEDGVGAGNENEMGVGEETGGLRGSVQLGNGYFRAGIGGGDDIWVGKIRDGVSLRMGMSWVGL